MITTLLLAVVLVSSEAEHARRNENTAVYVSRSCRGDGHNQHRSKSAVKKFKQDWSRRNQGLPCPRSCQTFVYTDGRYELYEMCGACEVDHICPLACCGLDAPQNMQWLGKKENKRKRDSCHDCRHST